MTGRTRNAAKSKSAKPYARPPTATSAPIPMRGTLVDQLNRLVAEDRAKPRFDVNASTLAEPQVGHCFTLTELEKMSGAHPEIGTACEMCHLPVPLWGFGWYIWDQEDGVLCVIYRICKACWRYSQSNPRYDWEEDTTATPAVSAACWFARPI